GARISAGKSGRVLMSLPWMAEVLVNWVPASCMPSPEAPARRMVTDSRSSRDTWRLGGSSRGSGAIPANLLLVVRRKDEDVTGGERKGSGGRRGLRGSSFLLSSFASGPLGFEGEDVGVRGHVENRGGKVLR